MAKSSTKPQAPAKKAAPKAAQHAPAPAKRAEAPKPQEHEKPAHEAPDARHDDDKGMETVHQRVLSNEEVAENAARERGAPATVSLDRDESPKVTGSRIVTDDDRPVMVDDVVVLHTPNPIEGQTENRAIVTKVNPNSTINVKVEIGGPGGLLRQFSSVQNAITQDRSPWWSWPEEDAKA